MALPTNAQTRKHTPITTGVLDYFPDALEEVAGCWVTTHAHADAIVSHLRKRGRRDAAGIRYSALIARHALSLLQKELAAAPPGVDVVPVGEERRIHKSPPELFARVLQPYREALAAVAELSRIGNEQHNPGQPMHWAKEKSTDEADALLRHLAEYGTHDADGVRHSVKVAWRALALLQREIDAEANQPLPYRITPQVGPVRVDAGSAVMFGKIGGGGKGSLRIEKDGLQQFLESVQDLAWGPVSGMAHVTNGRVAFVPDVHVPPKHTPASRELFKNQEVEHDGARYRVESRVLTTEIYYLKRGETRIRAHRDSITAHTERTFFEVGDDVEITGTGDRYPGELHGDKENTGRRGQVTEVDPRREHGRIYTVMLDPRGASIRYPVTRRFQDLKLVEGPPMFAPTVALELAAP